ncbi:MAG: hypothetical protein EAZ57_01670 [Cytophagales bacterium]|nr:MAG: hypothetical protein EAZ67_01605 [Cytophagales bacterium]TAF62157.1 MAG: hypothetical protein EAZ57_01670 [Cytophagales bacterium]
MLNSILALGLLFQIHNQDTLASKSKVAYYEDLSKYRIKANSITATETVVAINPAQSSIGEGIIPQRDDNDEIDAALVLIAQANEHLETIQGHRILVHSGIDKATAELVMAEAQKAAYGKVGDRVRMDYEVPNYKVVLGWFLNKVKAYQALKVILPRCPDAIVTTESLRLKSVVSSYKKNGRF